jgi:copper chaperone CopZ
METLKFKTNIKCTGCLAKVTPSLNETVGENNWKVDLEAPDRTLIIENSTSENEVVAAVKEAGFEAEKIY